jgi:hypothetical protein
MSRENRRDYREPEKAAISVSGNDPKGHPFEEQAETINISAVGLSFYLKTPISPQSFISVDLTQSKQFGYLGKVHAVVVRIETSSAEKNLVAAEFI